MCLLLNLHTWSCAIGTPRTRKFGVGVDVPEEKRLRAIAAALVLIDLSVRRLALGFGSVDALTVRQTGGWLRCRWAHGNLGKVNDEFNSAVAMSVSPIMAIGK